jgi:hypothetical protein
MVMPFRLFEDRRMTAMVRTGHIVQDGLVARDHLARPARSRRLNLIAAAMPVPVPMSAPSIRCSGPAVSKIPAGSTNDSGATDRIPTTDDRRTDEPARREDHVDSNAIQIVLTLDPGMT